MFLIVNVHSTKEEGEVLALALTTSQWGFSALRVPIRRVMSRSGFIFFRPTFEACHPLPRGDFRLRFKFLFTTDLRLRSRSRSGLVSAVLLAIRGELR